MPCLGYFGCLSLRNYFDDYCDCCPCYPTGCCRSGTVEPESQNQTDLRAEQTVPTTKNSSNNTGNHYWEQPKPQPTSSEIHEMNKRIAHYEKW